jgi:hypothetical protein
MHEINKHLKPGEEVLRDNNGNIWRVWVSLEDFTIPSDANENDILGYVNCSCEHVHPVKLIKKGTELIKHINTGYY